MGLNRKSIVPLVLVAFGGLLILGAAAWYGYTFTHQPTPVPIPTEIVESSYPDVPRISVRDAKAAYDLGEAVFVDVRDAESYAQSHIKGAKSIPLQDLPNRINELDPSAWIITYCT
jgi:3-mercaptopyruvate sulfurtransferase SseA